MLKKVHTHDDGRVCYRTDSLNEKEGGVYVMLGKEFVAMWNSYCAMWHVYDTDTGYEIASFRKEFYDAFISRYKVRDLLPDPNCIG